ncbi:hypothetical protein MTR67_012286 [Solanum verrucosum]|uniref:Uncharacterized protein n=1 Tax=Solanum verrucosum TaxID=315347 RepID=A0AAF0Q8M0_SOLVR|nr:hypothetical protein MTR67_012286 [Solanum verrucosum]
MEKMMTQIDLLMKHVMGCVSKAVNVVGTNSCVNPDDTQFEGMCNEEVQFLSNLARIPIRAIQDRDGDKDLYVPPHERLNPKEPRTDPKRFRTEDMLTHILNKVEG